MCAGCDAYYPWTAASLGVIAAVFYLMGSLTLVALKIDDPLDAFPIHCIAGIHTNMSISILFQHMHIRYVDTLNLHIHIPINVYT